MIPRFTLRQLRLISRPRSTRLKDCIAVVHQWLRYNGLQLNPNKSEVVQFTAGRGRERVDDISSLKVSDTVIQTSSTTKSLSVTNDRQLTFDQHVANVCKACYFHIRALRYVRHSGTMSQGPSLAAVTSRLDYCNSLFVGLTDRSFHQLQRVQNTSPRVLRAAKFDRITPALLQ